MNFYKNKIKFYYINYLILNFNKLDAKPPLYYEFKLKELNKNMQLF